MRVRAAALVCLLALSGCGTDTGSQLRARPGGTAAPSAGPAGAPNRQAESSCVGPFLDDDYPNGRPTGPAPTVHPGETLELHGYFYTRTCNDQGQDRPLVPMRDDRLTIAFPGGESIGLGPFTPSGRYLGFIATVHVPAGACEGTATVTGSWWYRSTFEFRIRR